MSVYPHLNKRKNPERPGQSKQKLDLTAAKQPTQIKRLLAQQGQVWLFEITEGNRRFYGVEQGESVLRFNLLFQAESRFLREAKKYSVMGKGKPTHTGAIRGAD